MDSVSSQGKKGCAYVCVCSWIYECLGHLEKGVAFTVFIFPEDCKKNNKILRAQDVCSC